MQQHLYHRIIQPLSQTSTRLFIHPSITEIFVQSVDQLARLPNRPATRQRQSECGWGENLPTSFIAQEFWQRLIIILLRRLFYLTTASQIYPHQLDLGGNESGNISLWGWQLHKARRHLKWICTALNLTRTCSVPASVRYSLQTWIFRCHFLWTGP